MAEPTIDDLYKSLQAADAAGDRQAAQALADYIRSLQVPTPSEKQIEMTTGAPLGVRAAVGSSTTSEDKLATLKKFFPDAQPYDKDNFIYTDPKTNTDE
jgi:DNA-binding transcriptional MocR family regulator